MTEGGWDMKNIFKREKKGKKEEPYYTVKENEVLKVTENVNDGEIEECMPDYEKIGSEDYESLDEYLANEIDRMIEEENKNARGINCDDEEVIYNDEVNYENINQFSKKEKKYFSLSSQLDERVFLIESEKFIEETNCRFYNEYLRYICRYHKELLQKALDKKYDIKQIIEAFKVTDESEKIDKVIDSISTKNEWEGLSSVSVECENEEEKNTGDVVLTRYDMTKIFIEDEGLEIIDDIDIWYEDIEFAFYNKKRFNSTQNVKEWLEEKGFEVLYVLSRNESMNQKYKPAPKERERWNNAEPYFMVRLGCNSDYYKNFAKKENEVVLI